MSKFAVVLCVIMCLGLAASGQTVSRNVTNADLEKFKQKRESAEREYRETYAAKGLPSPEEINRRNEAKQTAMEELAAKLRMEALERERLAAEIEARRASEPRNVTVIVPDGTYDSAIYSGGFATGGRFGRRFGNRIFRPRILSGYAAGGVLWPAPVGQRPVRLTTRPTFRRPRR
jgi:hypothetical protein